MGETVELRSELGLLNRDRDLLNQYFRTDAISYDSKVYIARCAIRESRRT